jgi:hypothetical protein
MSATSKTDWFWSDWLGDPAVRRLTPAERGVWIDLLALAAIGHPKGYVSDDNGRPLSLEEIARVTNAGSPDEVAEHIVHILKKGAASRDRTGRLFNRRMVRETELRAKRSRAGRLGAAHTNLIYKEINRLPRQVTQQMTQQNKTGPPRPFLKERKKESKTDRAKLGGVDNSPPPDTENVDGKQADIRGKRPADVSRSDLEKLFASKRASGAS